MKFDRTKSLGGTDVAAILGVHPYKSALDVWMEKARGFVKEVDNPAVEWGLRHEATVRQKYLEQTGHGIATPLHSGCDIVIPQPKYHPDHSWAHGTPDGICTANGETWGLEIKTANWRMHDRWDVAEGIIMPKEYYVQCAWYMWIFNVDRWDVAALVGIAGYSQFTLERDPELEAEIVQRAQAFWLEHVVADMEPPPEASAAYGQAINTLYPDDDGETIEADDEQADLIEEVAEIRAQLKPLNARLDEIKNIFKGTMKEAARLETEGSGYITFKTGKAKKIVDWAGIAAEVEPDRERLEFLAMKHTQTKEGARVLRMYPRSRKQ